jgi:hypothetical protein
MDSSDVQQALPTNGHVQLCDVEATSSNPVEPGDRPEQEEPFRSAQPDPPAAPEPSASPTKHLAPPVHTAKGASGPPTPQVKKVLSYFRPGQSFDTLSDNRIADFKLG